MPYGWPFNPFAPNIPETQTGEPQSVAQGDTLHFFKQVALPLVAPTPPAWALNYYLRGQAGAAINFQDNGTGQGGFFEVSIPPATTALWLPGDYEIAGYVTNVASAERHQVYLARINVTANLATLPDSQDTRTFAMKMRDNLEAVLQGKSLHDLKISEIERTHIERLTLDEMQKSWRFWDTRVRMEQQQDRADAGFATGAVILTRFDGIT